jgi:Zn finger protein HypA/HybF involved in hydrogenase expression
MTSVMSKDLKFFEEMGDFMNFEDSSTSSTDEEQEIDVEFCKCSNCQGEFMLDEGETLDKCPECGVAFDGEGD